jgi:hypothetical protein
MDNVVRIGFGRQLHVSRASNGAPEGQAASL